jgi:hypothetical protein
MLKYILYIIYWSIMYKNKKLLIINVLLDELSYHEHTCLIITQIMMWTLYYTFSVIFFFFLFQFFETVSVLAQVILEPLIFLL